jgi:glucose-6-phosphate isomerase
MTPIVVTGSALVNEQKKRECLQALNRLWERVDLGYLRLPENIGAWLKCQKLADELKNSCKKLIVVGMGGSYWGGRGLFEALGDPNIHLEFWGESEPHLLAQKLKRLHEVSPYESALAETHFLIISKSGNTLEIATMMNAIQAFLEKHEIKFAKQCTVITETRPNPLYNWATENNVTVIAHPQDVGGRFSIFTPVGLVPAAFGNVDIQQLRDGAAWVCTQNDLLAEIMARFAASFERGEKISVFWSYVHGLTPFLPWLEQLWAESLGKAQGRNNKSRPQVSTPIVASGVSAQHSVLQQFIEGEKDKFFVFLRSQDTAQTGERFLTSVLAEFGYLVGKTPGQIYAIQSRATEQSLIESGRSTMCLEINHLDAFTYGALLMTFEIVIGGLGELLDLNAFDQPGVELGKKIAKRQLESQL